MIFRAGSTAKVPAKETMEQLLPDLVTFLLTHPHVKSRKQVLSPAEHSPVCLDLPDKVVCNEGSDRTKLDACTIQRSQPGMTCQCELSKTPAGFVLSRSHCE